MYLGQGIQKRGTQLGGFDPHQKDRRAKRSFHVKHQGLQVATRMRFDIYRKAIDLNGQVPTSIRVFYVNMSVWVYCTLIDRQPRKLP